MRRAFAVLAVLLTVAMAAPGVWYVAGAAEAADRKAFTFDRAHSEINFVAEALLLSAHGFFERFDGDVQIDAENLTDSALKLTIETASINTRNERRDNHLRSGDFFDAANHPQITFVSNKVTRVDDRNLLLSGDLTIRGTTKPVEVPIQVVFLRDGRGRFKGEFRINRKDFGVNYNSAMNPIEDIVKVQFDLNLMDVEMQQRRQQQRQQQAPAQRPPQ